MPLFAPLSQAERRSLRATPASSVTGSLAALLQRHHARVIDLFRTLDKNADGEVSREELGQVGANLACAEEARRARARAAARAPPACPPRAAHRAAAGPCVRARRCVPSA